MFSIGEIVVYPAHGAGIIENIEERVILGESRRYYVLRLSNGDLQILVPVDTVEKAGLRSVCGREKLAEVERILSADSSPWDENWNRRHRLNMDKIRSGDICEVAEVVRNLALREMARGLSAGEKKMLEHAHRVLLSEMTLASGLTEREAAQNINLCLQRDRTDKREAKTVES